MTMDLSEIKRHIDIIASTPDTPHYFRIIPYSRKEGYDKERNQFIIFLKPECFSASWDIIIGLLLRKFNAFDVQIEGASLISGAYLRKHKIIDHHYGVLNRIAREGMGACSAHAMKKAAELYQDISQYQILGGYQFLKEYKDFSPYSLCVLNDNLGTQKLGSGTYSIAANLFNQKVLILNGFHPYQLGHLTRPGTQILAFACSSPKRWHDLRANLIGTINPQYAIDGSFRKELSDRRNAFSLGQIDVAHNYIHISPGPLEGLFQVIRFMSDYETKSIVPFEKTNLGMAHGLHFDENAMMALEKNPELSIDNAPIPIFDYTEDMDTVDVHDFLLKNFQKILGENDHAHN